MGSARTAWGLIAAGVVLVVVGLVGGFVAGGDDVEYEDPAEFYEQLQVAFNTGDGAFLFARLDPAVLEIYGEEQCRAWVETLQAEDLVLAVSDVSERGPYTFERDGESAEVPEAVTLMVAQRSDELSTAPQEAHVGYVNGEARWFTDCGDPI